MSGRPPAAAGAAHRLARRPVAQRLPALRAPAAAAWAARGLVARLAAGARRPEEEMAAWTVEMVEAQAPVDQEPAAAAMELSVALLALTRAAGHPPRPLSPQRGHSSRRPASVTFSWAPISGKA